MAWLLLVQLGILAVSLIASHYLAPRGSDDKMRARSLGDFNIPRANEGAAIPLLYGTSRLRSPIVVRVGDLNPVPVTIDGQAIAFDYFLHMRMVLCRGNASLSDTSGGASLVGMFIGDKLVDRIDAFGGQPDGASNVSYTLTDGSVFASEPEGDVVPVQGPYVIGAMFFYRGRWDQVLHSQDESPTEIQAYVTPMRGQVAVSLGWAASFGSNWRIGSSGSIPPYSFVVHNPVAIPGYEAATAPIGNGDANPAAILYDLLINQWGCVGADPSTIDLDAFAAVAQTLQDEQHGMSLVVQNTTTARDLIEVVLKQTDGVLYTDPSTSKMVYRLIRDDYDVGDLFVVDKSNAEPGSVKLHKTTWEDVPGEVLVTFTDAAKDWSERTIPAQNAAVINAQGGRKNRAEFTFPGCSNEALATFLATRELNFLSRPLMKVSVTVNRGAGILRPGDPFRFQWAGYGAGGIDVVMRVMDLSGGTLEDGAITITGVQDRFSIPGPIYVPEDQVNDPAQLPIPISLRTITEAPRWVQLQAFNAGNLANVDGQRGMYLAAPVYPDSRYRVDTDGSSDAPVRVFPGTFTVSTSYARSVGPYDTGTGLVIDDVTGWTPTAATATQIATEGRNLIQIGDELLAFETVTGSGPYTLGNVWRGVLDTVPSDIASGAVGYVLPSAGTSAMGTRVLTHASDHEMVTLAAAGNGWTAADDSPRDAITVRSRVRLPYPVDALLVNGSQSPAQLVDDGATLQFATRARLAASITRPDAAAETPEAGTSYVAVAIKDGARTDIATGITSSGSTTYHLGGAGHGLLEVGVDSSAAVILPDGSTPTLGAWQVPTVQLDAPYFRNLVINGNFATSANWTVTAGSAVFGAGTGSLGGGGTMVTTSSAQLALYQDIPIGGYHPGNLRGLLRFAAGPVKVDTDDTFTVTVTQRDATGSVLATSTIGPTHTNVWDRYEIGIASLDPDTTTIRVALQSDAVGGDIDADIAFSEVKLYVGQFSDQLLGDAEFTTTASWSQTVGTWSNIAIVPYGALKYVQPDSVASAQLRQDVAPPAGFEIGSAAVLQFGRMNDGADDTGSVTLAALDAGSSVLASVSSATEAITPTNAWSSRVLTLALPASTAYVRVQCDATRVTGTPLNTAFGDFDLRVHKQLDPVVDIDHAFTSPPTQRIPRTRGEWLAAFPAVYPPNVAMYDGGAAGRLGTEPLLETVGSATMAGTFICDEGRWDGRRRTNCYDLTGGSVRVAPVGNAFLNFRSTEDWAVAVVYKSDTWQGNEAGLIARVTLTAGWELGLDAGGTPTAIVQGPGGSASAIGTTLGDPGFGVMRIAVAHYDASASELSVIDHDGVHTVSTSSVGEFRTAEADQATVGTGSNFGAITGQIARIWAWRGTSTPAASALAGIFTYADNAAGIEDPHPRTGYVVTVDGEDATSQTVRGWPIGVAPYVLDEEAGVALVSSPNVANLIDFDLSTWTPVGGSQSITVDATTGMRNARGLLGTSSQGLRSPTLALGAAGTRHFRVIAWTPNNACQLVLEDNSGSTVATHTLAQLPDWHVHEFALSWTGATSGNARIRIAPSTTGSAGSMELSPVMLASSSTVAPAPRVIPVNTAGTVCPAVAVSPTVQANSEGELLATGAMYAAGTIARAWNGSDDHDARAIAFTGGGDVEAPHFDGAGSSDTATVTPSSIDTATAYTARLRWSRGGLRDGVSSEFTSLRLEQGAVVEVDTGRSATWTPGTVAPTRIDIGHDDGADVAAAAISRVRLRVREPRL